MSKELIINASLPEVRIALLEEGKVQELIVERVADRGVVGNIYKGRVTRVLPGMQAAFVDIGLDKAAFLYVDDVVLHTAENVQEIAGEIVGELPEELQSLEEDSDQGEGDEVTGEEGEEIEAAADEGSEGDFEAVDDVDVASAETVDGEAEEEIEETDGTEASESSESSESSDSDEKPEDMGPPPEEGDSSEDSSAPPAGTVSQEASSDSSSSTDGGGTTNQRRRSGSRHGGKGSRSRGRSRRNTRGSRRGRSGFSRQGEEEAASPEPAADYVAEGRIVPSDREDLTRVEDDHRAQETEENIRSRGRHQRTGRRREFRQKRRRDRRIRSSRSQSRRVVSASIDELLKEGQEVIVQVAKEPIANKGARLTCHVSLPGRHLVCMPTIDHIGVSRRIDQDTERRRLRELVEKHRPGKMGFIVRTASGGQETDPWIVQDVEYLSDLWKGIMDESEKVAAPALIYEDMNVVLRSIRDWATEDINKIIVDSRYHFNEIKDFVERLVPTLKDRVELYHGDIPIFDAYGVASELNRALERRVWLKSGGYIVVDQAEALVAIDVNTGRYVGKKNLEDTILKTNLEAIDEITYQLRLRNCGGIIIIDLIDMEREENRFRVLRALEHALQKDRARPTIVKMTDLGLIEMTRKRTRDTMVRTHCQTCNHCEGRGFIKSKSTVAYDILREIERAGVDREFKKILVQAHQEVIEILALDEKETLDLLEKRYRKEIFLQAIDDYHPEQFNVVGDELPRRAGRQYRPRPKNPRSYRERNDRGRGGRSRGRGGSRRTTERSGSESRRGTSSSAEAERDSNLEESAGNLTDGNTSDSSHLPDNVGNAGNYASTSDSTASESTGIRSSQESASGGSEDDLNEEDRLAYLRAQAAQDAALASYGDSKSQNLTTTPTRGRNSRGGRGGHRGNGSGGGGRGGGGSRRPGGRGGRSGRGGARGGRRYRSQSRDSKTNSTPSRNDSR